LTAVETALFGGLLEAKEQTSETVETNGLIQQIA